MALVLIGLLLVLGKILRRTIPLFERIYLPTSIIAGGLALLVGPQVMGDGLIPEAVLEVWAELPVLLISVVFAGLFIGKRILVLTPFFGLPPLPVPSSRSGSRAGTEPRRASPTPSKRSTSPRGRTWPWASPPSAS